MSYLRKAIAEADQESGKIPVVRTEAPRRAQPKVQEEAKPVPPGPYREEPPKPTAQKTFTAMGVQIATDHQIMDVGLYMGTCYWPNQKMHADLGRDPVVKRWQDDKARLIAAGDARGLQQLGGVEEAVARGASVRSGFYEAMHAGFKQPVIDNLVNILEAAVRRIESPVAAKVKADQKFCQELDLPYTESGAVAMLREMANGIRSKIARLKSITPGNGSYDPNALSYLTHVLPQAEIDEIRKIAETRMANDRKAREAV